jgi:murein DD-endopeptidase MepM/ murein hydrolase activator NlpD
VDPSTRPATIRAARTYCTEVAPTPGSTWVNVADSSRVTASQAPPTAAAPGVVVAVGHGAVGYGNYVVIAHGAGLMTLYGHLLETDVNVGAAVARGQRIGLEGSTGWSTGPHVHFELRANDAVVDPMPYLAAPTR